MCDTSEGRPNLLSSALPEIPSDPGFTSEGTRLSDGLCRPEGIAFKRRACGSRPEGLGRGSTQEGPSQASEPHWRAVMGQEPRLTAFLLPWETFHYQINIEKSPPPSTMP